MKPNKNKEIKEKQLEVKWADMAANMQEYYINPQLPRYMMEGREGKCNPKQTKMQSQTNQLFDI